MSMSFDGANYLIGVENHQTPSPTLAAQRVSADGQFIGRDGSLIGGKLSLSTDPGNQLGGASFANGRYLVLVNNGVNMGEGGISQVDSATGTFVDPLPLLQVLTSDSAFGVRPNGFGFTISGTSGQTFVVEACANLVASDWSPLQTNTIVDGSSTFSDSAWTNYPGRFYRLRSP